MKKTLRLVFCCIAAMIFIVALTACEQKSVSDVDVTGESDTTGPTQETTTAPLKKRSKRWMNTI